MARLDDKHGFTLLELLTVLGITGVLLALAAWQAGPVLQKWQVQSATTQVLTDLKATQQRAAGLAGVRLEAGQLVASRLYLVFDENRSTYDLFHWQDENGDGYTDRGETGLLASHQLPAAVKFTIGPGVTRRACGNSPGMPSRPITFTSAGYPPCNGRPCLRFDRYGFNELGPGAVYFSKDGWTYAISGTRVGNFNLCRWDGEWWR